MKNKSDSLIENFERLCDEYGLEYTRDDTKRGLILCYNGEELQVTKEHIDAMFKFDDYYNLEALKG